MKQIIALLLALTLLLGLTGCQSTPVESTLPPTETTAPVTTEADTTPTETEPQWSPYAGTMLHYVYHYDSGRELEWEEDLLYFAQLFLDDYGPLSPFPYRVETQNKVEYLDGHYIPEWREAFIAEINDLILNLPQLTDADILYRLEKMMASMQDLHLGVELPETKYFPLELRAFYENEQPVFYVIGVTQVHHTLLYTKLIAINGIPIEQVIQKMEPWVCYENSYALNAVLSSWGSYLTRVDMLTLSDVIGENDKIVTFRFLDDSGNEVEREFHMYTGDQLSSLFWAYHGISEVNALMSSTEFSTNYWYKIFDREDTAYIRIKQFSDAENYTLMNLGNELLQEVRTRGSIGKVIIDLRYNPGGYRAYGYPELINVLSRMDIGTLYVLVDDCSYSASVLTAAAIKTALPETVLVGTPAGQPPNFYAGMNYYEMPNSGYDFQIPSAWYDYMPDYPYDALMPDVVIYPTIEDYQNNVDTILEAVFAMP